MATFPHSLCGIRQDGHGEQHMPMVLRSDMERGIPKQRSTGADVRVHVPCSLVFRSAADAAAFESWFYAEGRGWFDFTLPRTGAVVQARIIGGDIGTLSPLTPAWNASERSVVLEYVRPAFVTLAPGLYDVDSSRILSVQRNTTATYIDGSGVLQTAPANTARYQGGQLLVEGEATNLCLQSQDLSNGSAWAGNVSASLATELYRGFSPFWTLSKTLASTSENRTTLSYPVYSGAKVVLTVAMLAGSSADATIGLWDQANATWGLSSESACIILEGPGFVSNQAGGRFDVAGLSMTQPTLLRLERVYSVSTTARFFIYPGRFVSNVIGVSVKATRVQICLESDGGSYIPTTTAAVTRAADIITVAA